MTALTSESTHEDVKEHELKKLQRKREIERGICEIMSTRDGRRYILRTLKNCSLFNTSFTGNSRTFFNEGKREIGLDLYKNIQMFCKSSWDLMVREASVEGVLTW